MSTIKSKEDGAYVVNQDDLIPLVDSTGATPKAVTPLQITKATQTWQVVETIELLAEIDNFSFSSIPAGATLIKIEGILKANSTAVMQAALRLNSNSGSIYQWLKEDHPGVSITFSESASDTSIPFTSAWSNNEHAIIEIIIVVDGAVQNAIKSSTFNNGGKGDWHIVGGHASLGADVSSVDFITIAPFANDFGIGTKLTLSVMY